MNRLEQIIAVKRAEVDRLREKEPELNRRASLTRTVRGFRRALQRSDDQLAIVAEVKKASPSAGVIAPQVDPIEKAKNYEIAGADAVSVLTDQSFFQGSVEHLVGVQRAISLPILRKDFIVDEIQIVESAAAGADAILLIVAALTEAKLRHLAQTASEYQLDALIEVHSADELDRALAVGAEIIGINNRNLATFEVDLSVTEQLTDSVPEHIVLVSESGFKTVQDVRRARSCGVDAILVGEALMRGETSIQQLRGA